MSEGSFTHSDETQFMICQRIDFFCPLTNEMVALQRWQAESTLTEFVPRLKQPFIITRVIAHQVIATRLCKLIFSLNTVSVPCDCCCSLVHVSRMTVFESCLYRSSEIKNVINGLLFYGSLTTYESGSQIGNSCCSLKSISATFTFKYLRHVQDGRR